MADRDLVGDLQWGAGFGAAAGIGLTLLFGVLPSLIRLDTYFESVDLTLLELSITYIMGGLLIGVVMGALRPLTKTAKGCAIIGLVSGPPTAILALALFGELRSFPLNLIFGAFWTLVYCPIMGVAAWIGESKTRASTSL